MKLHLFAAAAAALLCAAPIVSADADVLEVDNFDFEEQVDNFISESEDFWFGKSHKDRDFFGKSDKDRDFFGKGDKESGFCSECRAEARQARRGGRRAGKARVSRAFRSRAMQDECRQVCGIDLRRAIRRAERSARRRQRSRDRDGKSDKFDVEDFSEDTELVSDVEDFSEDTELVSESEDSEISSGKSGKESEFCSECRAEARAATRGGRRAGKSRVSRAFRSRAMQDECRQVCGIDLRRAIRRGDRNARRERERRERRRNNDGKSDKSDFEDFSEDTEFAGDAKAEKQARTDAKATKAPRSVRTDAKATKAPRAVPKTFAYE